MMNNLFEICRGTYLVSAVDVDVDIGKLTRVRLARNPSLGACNYPIFLSRRFHRPIYFYFEQFISNSDPHRNLSDQLQSQARTNVGMSTSCPREAALF